MKKQFFLGILALMLVAFLSYGINKNQSVNQISDLALQNVEALASIEGPGGGSPHYQIIKWCSFLTVDFACVYTYTSMKCTKDC